MLRELSTRIRVSSRWRASEESLRRSSANTSRAKEIYGTFHDLARAPKPGVDLVGLRSPDRSFYGRKARHLGVDLPVELGIIYTGDGIVTHHMDRRLGNILVIEHSAEEISEQGKLHSPGQLPARRQDGRCWFGWESASNVIAHWPHGSMGCSTGPHLHYAALY